MSEVMVEEEKPSCVFVCSAAQVTAGQHIPARGLPTPGHSNLTGSASHRDLSLQVPPAWCSLDIVTSHNSPDPPRSSVTMLSDLTWSAVGVWLCSTGGSLYCGAPLTEGVLRSRCRARLGHTGDQDRTSWPSVSPVSAQADSPPHGPFPSYHWDHTES